MRMSRILDDDGAPTQLPDILERTYLAVQVDRKNCARSVHDPLNDLVRVRKAGLSHVDEHRFGSCAHDRERARYEGQSWHDHAIAPPDARGA